jgi:hypothetical protein
LYLIYTNEFKVHSPDFRCRVTQKVPGIKELRGY